MTPKEKKIEKLLQEETNYNINEHFDTIEFEFTIEGEPKPYARPRFTRFGGANGKGRCYNARSGLMDSINKDVRTKITDENKEIIKNIIEQIGKNPDYKYYVHLNSDFFIKIPKSDTIQNTVLKEKGIIKPTVAKGDLDNYNKLLLDSLHNVIYHDDKHVIEQFSRKLYSINPRIDVKIKIIYER